MLNHLKMKTIVKTASSLLFLAALFISGCYPPPDDDPIYPIDEIAPAVSIVFPPVGTVAGGLFLIRAIAADNEGIQKVQLFVDGLPQPQEDYQEPYELFWDTWYFQDLVPHVITVRAYDYSYNMADSDPVTYFLDKGSVYPKPVKIHKIFYADSSYYISWTFSKDPNFESYALQESMLPDLSDEKEVFSTHLITDTSFVVTLIPWEDTRYYRVKITNKMGYEAFSEVMKAQSPAPPPPLPLDGLMAYYPFNGNALDESGNGHDGVVYDAVLATDRHGNPESAYDFEQFQGTIQVTNPGSFNYLEAFTLAAWVDRKSNYTGPSQDILVKVSPQRDFVLQLGPEGHPTVHYAYDPGVYYSCWATSVAPVAKWIHIAATWSGNAWNLYINGELVASANHAGHQPPWTGGEMYIGSMGTGEVFQGLIDEVLIYDRALSALEIVGLSQL
jgi:hypothetical protein